jgi:hypothetical protein
VTYAFCNHSIVIGTEVLYVYPEGDCDTGVVTSINPLLGFGCVTVRLDDGTVLVNEIVESISHLHCDEE